MRYDNGGSGNAIEDSGLTNRIIAIVVAVIVTAAVLVPVADGLADANGGGGGSSPITYTNTGNIYYTDDLGDDVVSIYKTIENVGGIDYFTAHVDYNDEHLITTPALPVADGYSGAPLYFSYYIGLIDIGTGYENVTIHGGVWEGLMYVDFDVLSQNGTDNVLMSFEYEDGDDGPHDDFAGSENPFTFTSEMLSGDGIGGYILISNADNANYVYAKNPYVTPSTTGVIFRNDNVTMGSNVYAYYYSYYGSIMAGNVQTYHNFSWGDTSQDLYYQPYDDPQTVIVVSAVNDDGINRFDGLSVSFEWDDPNSTEYSEINQYAIVPITVQTNPLPGPSAKPISDVKLMDIQDVGASDWQIWYEMTLNGNNVDVSWEVEDDNGTRTTQVSVPLNKQAILFAFYNEDNVPVVSAFGDVGSRDVVIDVSEYHIMSDSNSKYLSDEEHGEFTFSLYPYNGAYRFESDGSYMSGIVGGYIVSPEGDYALYAPKTAGESGYDFKTALISLNGLPTQLITDNEVGQTFWCVYDPLVFDEENTKVHVEDWSDNGGGGDIPVVSLIARPSIGVLRAVEPAGGTLVGDLYYTFSSSNGYVATVVGIAPSLESATSISVPATVTYDTKTYQVKNVGNYAFQGLTSLQSITFGTDVLLNIGDYAFDGCTSLSEGTIPTSSASTDVIGEYAFRNTAGVMYLDEVCRCYNINEGAFQGATLKVSADLEYNTITFRNGGGIRDSAFEGATFQFLGDMDLFTLNVRNSWFVGNNVFKNVTLQGLTGDINLLLNHVGDDMFAGWNVKQVLFYESEMTYGQSPFVDGSIDTAIFIRGARFSNSVFEGVPVNTFIVSGSSTTSIGIEGDRAFGTQNGATIILGGGMYFYYDQNEDTPDSFAGLTNCRVIDVSEKVCESGSEDSYLVANMRDMGLDSSNTVIDEIPITAMVWKVGTAYKLTNSGDSGGSSITGTLIKVVPVFVLISVLLYAVQFFSPKPY